MDKIIICAPEEALLPEKKSEEAMCRDIKTCEDFTLEPGELKLIKSGIKTYIPTGRACKMYARSSLPIKNGLILANNVGIFDSDYRGEYLMQLYNFTDKTVNIDAYTRLCQLEFCPHYRGEAQFGTKEIPEIELIADAELFERFDQEYPSERGTGGLGSTGKK